MALLIEIAGVDGAGKTTLIGLLRKAINADGSLWAYERTFRDRHRRFLEQIAIDAGCRRAPEIFAPDVLAVTSALGLVDEALRAFYYCRSNEDGQVYCVDHYYTSGLAGAIADGVSTVDSVAHIYGYLPQPHLSIYLELPAGEALRRLEHRQSGDQVLHAASPLALLSRRVAAFETAHRHVPYRQERIDATLSIDEVAATTLQLVRAVQASGLDAGWVPIRAITKSRICSS
jgi:thymidylate kinase